MLGWSVGSSAKGTLGQRGLAVLCGPVEKLPTVPTGWSQWAPDDHLGVQFLGDTAAATSDSQQRDVLCTVGP